MGCLSSRSVTVSPIDSSASANNRNKRDRKTKSPGVQANGYPSARAANTNHMTPNGGGGGGEFFSSGGVKQKRLADIGTSLEGQELSLNRSFNVGEGDTVSIQMTERDRYEGDRPGGEPFGSNASTGRSNRNFSSSARNDLNNSAAPSGRTTGDDGSRLESGGGGDNKLRQRGQTYDEEFGSGGQQRANQLEREGDTKEEEEEGGGIVTLPGEENEIKPTDKAGDDGSRDDSLERELNTDLLRQYIAVDYEISQLEDRDALRLYHEKIEQLEQLERELDMISFEAEEMAVQSESELGRLSQNHSPSATTNRPDLESNSIMSGATGSMSPKSSIMRKQPDQSNRAAAVAAAKRAQSKQGKQQQQQQQLARIQDQDEKSAATARSQQAGAKMQYSKENNLSYSTIEDVFNRKIILEKERDKLKKEVELVIIECDKLQQRYKKRDEILDKLFDGRTGNGLENHLEQQLIWLMEQKHYVDQVFYAWKRAETLTSQTCEQFANALELLKRLPKVQEDEQRVEMAKSICNLLVKSRQDMEQAQKYNPNVDAPFFTDAETERFDRIIRTIQSESISQSDYNQMATVVQFAYKRAVSIRLWLEQILQITIARDSFELAEEYKWIAIQLRKERISLINSKLQEAPYRAMAHEIREQMAKLQQQQQQQLQQQQQQQQLLQLAGPNQLAMIGDGKSEAAAAAANGTSAPAPNSQRQQNEVNRDSGVESDDIDIDIEEDIYRLLEMNKGRLEAAVAASKQAGLPQATALDAAGRPTRSQPQTPAKGGQLTALAPTPIHPAVQQLQQQAAAANAAGSTSQRDQMMRERIQRRVQGEQRLASSVVPLASVLPASAEASSSGLADDNGGGGGGGGPSKASVGVERPSGNGTANGRPGKASAWEGGMDTGGNQTGQTNQRSEASVAGHARNDDQAPTPAPSSTPSKLQIQLDEASRQNLLKQVDQVHAKHRNRLDNLRGNNKAKANDFLLNKLHKPDATG